MTDTYAVTAEGLGKRFGDRWVLSDVDLAVPAGTVLGLLGPNGAGKTTTVRILTTLFPPDAGHATVAGFDVVRDAAKVRPRIGLAGQQATVDDLLTGRGNLEMVGKLYHLPRHEVKARAAELLEWFNLTDAGDRLVKTYSGGMRRRLDLAGSLVARPPVLFLDEPTTGLDPSSRGDLWALLKRLVDDGTTLLLTTQYMEEADALAGDIAVIDGGRVIASGTPVRGTVAHVARRKAGGNPGTVTVSVTSVRAVDGTRIPLRGTTKVSGKNRQGQAAAFGVLTFGIGATKKGLSAVIPAGTQFSVFTDAKRTIVVDR